ncbi:MAG: CTP synthase (glutamine hydrolyzing) [DPANN group archaeon]|nr:CTP synthase (glutamine hydrolyzing) [DPANN group archaeon]
MEKKTQYIFITGGVMSGLGKGILTVSIGKLLQAQNYSIAPLKIDPYLNIDAGTMNPLEHGEVFVLDDGGEVDMDLGNYERFLEMTLSIQNNLTTGKIYKHVIDKERKGDYLGKTVQIIPHITCAIQDHIKKIGKGKDFVLIEVGGTVGDIESIPFLEAARELSVTEDVYFIHLVLVPTLDVVGEQKTKPAQHSVRILGNIGIRPNMIVCRCKDPLINRTKRKISLFCGVKEEDVISDHDANIYELPLILKEQKIAEKIINHFDMKHNGSELNAWTSFVNGLKNIDKKITIAMTGKYTQLHDSYVSINEALNHARSRYTCEIEIKFIETTHIENNTIDLKTALKDVDALIVPGGFGSRGTEGKIRCIKYARENNIPFLGLCLGFQLACVEFARNVCNLKDATSTEINPDTKIPIINIMASQKKIDTMGATMRLGAWPANLKKGSLAEKLYGKTEISERHRHRYEVNNSYVSKLEKNGLIFSGKSPDQKLMEFLELDNHPYFIATQAHPELKSKPLTPHPLFLGLVEAAIKKRYN